MPRLTKQQAIRKYSAPFLKALKEGEAELRRSRKPPKQNRSLLRKMERGLMGRKNAKRT